MEICGRNRGFSKKERREAVCVCARSYRESMAKFSQMWELDIWYDHVDVERALDESERSMKGKTIRTLRRALERARSKDNLRAATKLAHAHARSGDGVAIASYLGEDEALEGAMCAFAAAYADQNEEDYRAFLKRHPSRGSEAPSGFPPKPHLHHSERR